MSRPPSSSIWGHPSDALDTAHTNDSSAYGSGAGAGGGRGSNSAASSARPAFAYEHAALAYAAGSAQSQSQSQPSLPQWDPHENSLSASLDPLPQPFRSINAALQDIVDRAWAEAARRARDGRASGDAGGAEKDPLQSMNDEQGEEAPPGAGRVQLATQSALNSTAEMLAAAPTRIVAPVFPSHPPSTAAAANALAPTLPAVSAALSQDGRLALVGSRLGPLYVADLARSYAFAYALQVNDAGPGTGAGAAADQQQQSQTAPALGPVSCVAISPQPVLRGDEVADADEHDTHANYLIAWTNAPTTSAAAAAAAGQGQVVRVATLNALRWEFYHGCDIVLPAAFPVGNSPAARAAAAATSTLLGSGASGTVVTGLLFSADGSHLAVGTADGSQSVYALRPHRHDPLLEAPRVSQKEALLAAGAGAAGGGTGSPKAAAAAPSGATMRAAAGTPLPGYRSLDAGAAAASAAAAAAAADLAAALADSSLDLPGHGHGGLSVVETRTLATVQAKLYTAVLVLHAPVPRGLLDNLLAIARKNAPSGAGPASAATGPGAGATSPSVPALKGSADAKLPPLSPSSSASSSKTNSRASLKLDAAAAAALLASSSAAAAAADAAVAAIQPPRCLAPSWVHFLTAPCSRHPGAMVAHKTSAVVLAWRGDCAWSRWELGVVRPVLPGESPAALAAAMALGKNLRPHTPGTVMPSQVPAAAKGAAVASKGAAATGAKEKDGGGGAAALAAAAAAAAQADSSQFLCPTPASQVTPTGSPISATSLALGLAPGAFLAVGLLSGSIVLWDTRLLCVRLVLHGTPALSHAMHDPFSTGTPTPPAAVTCLDWWGSSHLVAGTGDRSVRVFTLPPNFARAGSDRSGADANLPVRISARLPGVVRSVRVGTRVPVAIVGVDAPAARASGSPATAQQLQEFYVYDLLSNYFIGKLVPPSAATGSGSPSSTAHLYGSGGKHFPVHHHQHTGAPHSNASTGDFAVYEEKEDGSSFVMRSGSHTHGHGHGHASVPRIAAAGAAAATYYGEHEADEEVRMRTSRGSESFRAREAAGAGPATVEPPPPVAFDALSLSHGAMATLDADQIVLLGSSGSSSSGGSAPSTSLLVYPLTDLIVSLYPSIASSCSNAFLRQKHALGMFLHYPTHGARRHPAAFGAYLAEQDRAVAQGNQNALSAAFAAAPGRSVVGSTRGSVHGGGSARRHSRSPSASSSIGGGGGRSRVPAPSSYQPLLGSIHSRVGSAASASSMGAGGGHHRRMSSSSSSIASGGQHRRSASRSRSRDRAPGSAASRQHLPPPPPPDLLPESMPRDVASIVHGALAAAAASAHQRSAQQLKARRVEMQQQIKAHQQLQTQQSRYGGSLLAQQQQQGATAGLVLPRLPQAIARR